MSSYSTAILFSSAITFQHRASSLNETQRSCLWISSSRWWHTTLPADCQSPLFFFFFNMTKKSLRLKSMGNKEADMTEWLHWLIDVFIYVAVPGFPWGMWTLSCGMGPSSLTRGIKLGPPLNWQHKVLATKPPGKSFFFFFFYFSNLFQQYIKNIWKFYLPNKV